MRDGWKEVELGEVCDVINGFAFKSKDFVKEGIPLVKIKELKNNRLNISDCDYLPRDFVVDKKYHINKGDVVIALTGSHITLPSSAVGRVAKSYLDETLLLNQRVGKLKVFEDKCDMDFLYFNLTSEYFFNSVGLLAKGAANQANISAGDVKSIKINLPPLETQTKIASILSGYDDLIENNLKRIKILEEMAQQTYEEWFVRMRFPGYESATINPEVRLAEGWKKLKLGDLGEIVTGKTPSTSNEEYYNGNIPFIKTPDMNGSVYVIETNQYLTQSGSDSQKNKILDKNDLVVSCIGSAGAYALISRPSQFNQQINAIRFKKDGYVYFAFCYAKGLKEVLEALGSNGATMTNVNKGKFEQIEIVLPDDDLLNKFHQFAKPCFEVILNLQNQNQRLREARDILLPRLMMGMIAV